MPQSSLYRQLKEHNSLCESTRLSDRLEWEYIKTNSMQDLFKFALECNNGEHYYHCILLSMIIMQFKYIRTSDKCMVSYWSRDMNTFLVEM